MSDHHSNSPSHQASGHHQKDSHQGGNHHILTNKMALLIWGLLMVLTITTVAVAQIDLGVLNFAVAMLVASIKAGLVCLFFMGLKYDHKENAVIFSTSIIFMAIFMILTFGDLLTRGDIYVNGPIVPETAGAPVKSKFKKAWIVAPELLARGKESFQSNCVTCHGPEGKGDGAAAAGLNPRPRDFTVTAGWKNGRKPSQVFQTLSKGLGGMPSFASLPSDDRWALVHYVNSLASPQEKDSDADLTKIGIDPNSDTGGAGGAEKAIPVSLAIDEMADKNTADVAAEAAPPATLIDETGGAQRRE